MLSPTETDLPGWNRADCRELGIVALSLKRNEGLELSERVKDGSPLCSPGDAELLRGSSWPSAGWGGTAPALAGGLGRG